MSWARSAFNCHEISGKPDGEDEEEGCSRAPDDELAHSGHEQVGNHQRDLLRNLSLVAIGYGW